jgi:hypothetical protein
VAQEPRVSIRLDDFPGLIDNTDPRNIPPGAAQLQINCASYQIGELIIRAGTLQVKFENQ